MIRLKIIFIISALIATVAFGQQIININFALVNPGESKREIISKAAAIVPTPQQYEWQKLEFIGFLHFGINTFTDKEWGEGNESPKIFNPEKLNAEQWIRTLKDAGMKMAILTAKHHDGFCLWPSKFTEHSVKNSPWKNGKGDVVREFVNACRKYGMKVGLYLSPWDRNNPDYGDSPRYNEYYKNQLRELLTDYGEITEVWFDGACGEGPNGKKQVYDWQAYYRVIRELQPDAVIFGMSPDIRWVGTETGYGRETEWSVVPLDMSRFDPNKMEDSAYPLDEIFNPHDMTDYDLGSSEKLIASKGFFWYPAETDVSIRPGWFYHQSQDKEVKSPEKLVDIYFNSVGRNGVFLLNIPPDKKGLINENDIASLKKFSGIIKNTFSDNLASGSVVSFSEEEIGKPYSGIFGKDKFLQPEERSGEYIIQLKLSDKKNFDTIMLQEEIRRGQRVEKFHVDELTAGQWKKIAEGTTIGYKRLLKIPAVSTDRIRIVIEKCRAVPAISNVGLYKLKM